MGTNARFKDILSEAITKLETVKDPEQLSNLRTAYLGRKGILTTELRNIAALPSKQRQAAGKAGNAAKRQLEERFRTAAIEQSGGTVVASGPVDPTLPGTQYDHGHLHPITLVLREVEDIFHGLGFDVVEGPEVEDDWHNFEALNMGPEHSARDMQDTFYLAGSEKPDGTFGLLPRTHTSGVQIRTLQERKPPLRIITHGKVYRNETEDATHSAVFNQVEGLMLDRGTTFADLKGIMTVMVCSLLGEQTKLRFRPSFFPYTEPSAEIDVSSPDLRGGEWLELAGAGMVHPNVLKNTGVDPTQFQGFAFGIGVERVAMLKYGIEDLRTFFRPDVRILEQF